MSYSTFCIALTSTLRSYVQQRALWGLLLWFRAFMRLRYDTRTCVREFAVAARVAVCTDPGVGLAPAGGSGLRAARWMAGGL